MKSLFAVGIIRGLSWLPFVLVQGLGWLLGHLVYWLPSQTRQETVRNIARCFPEMKPAQQQALVKASVLHTAMGTLEMGHNWCARVTRNRRRVTIIKGAEVLATKRSRIILTPHFGSWEMFGIGLTPYVDATAMYKPSKLPAVDTLIRQGRLAYGMQGLASIEPSGLRKLIKALRHDEGVILLPDQEPPPEGGQLATFFGQPAYTMTLACQLAASKGLPVPPQIILGWAKRLGIGKGFGIELIDITEAMTQPTVQASVQAMNDALEALIRKHPEQYHWEYRRFKYTLEQLDKG